MKFLYWCTMLTVCSSCAIEFEVESQRTVLEKQILGAYEELDDDLIMISSVRAVDETGKKKTVKTTPLEKRALDARQNQQFNQDDLRELLDKQILGEAQLGKVAVLNAEITKKSKSSKEDLKLAGIIVSEENRDRKVIWQRVIEKSPDLSKKDLPLVQENYQQQVIEKLAKGHWYQTSNGKWVRKK